MPTLLDELSWRGLLYDATDGLQALLANPPVTAYAGFDPTAPSLHVGHLLPALTLSRLQRFGHQPIALIGGATGMIGDPSGKSQERVLLSADQIAENVAGVSRQLSSFLDVGPGGARLVDNASWLARLDLLGFLRDTGKHFTVNYLLQKESVSRRLESEEGISFTEFSYSLLQARDYLELFERYGCRLQIGGSDQWGNITAGIELIRKLRGERVHGLVIPLLTTASGQKFGKTEAGAVWLDPARTSPYRFYQFWMNTDDADVVRYLRYFTFLTREEIEDLERASRGEPEKRAAQRVLAAELTRLIHGADQLARAERATALLFGEPIEGLSASEVLAVFDDVPSTEIGESEVSAALTVVDLVVRAALAPSKSEARRLVQAGGIYVNNSRTTDPAARFGRANAIDGRVLVVRKGARQNHVFVLT